MVVEEQERELGVEETTIDPTYNAVQSLVLLEIPKSLRNVTYSDWMRIRTKWALTDMECFVCICNNQCERDIDGYVLKATRRQQHTALKELIHNDPLWQYMPDIDVRVKDLNKKLYQIP